jgi:hypothetical protein
MRKTPLKILNGSISFSGDGANKETIFSPDDGFGSSCHIEILQIPPHPDVQINTLPKMSTQLNLKIDTLEKRSKLRLRFLKLMTKNSKKLIGN